MRLPDHETHMSEVQSLGEEARERAPDPQGRPDKVSTGTIAPIYMGKDHEVIPDRYVLHFSETRCRNCAHVETSSDFFALSYIRSRVHGTRVRHLVKTSAPLYNLPVDRIRTGVHLTPYCAHCGVINLTHLPDAPEPSQLRDLPEPTLKGRKPAGERQPKEKTTKQASLDDLI